MVLWKEQPVSYISMIHRSGKMLTSSRPVHPVIMPWRIPADSHQRSRIWCHSWVCKVRKNCGINAMIWPGNQECRLSRERWLPPLQKGWCLNRDRLRSYSKQNDSSASVWEYHRREPSIHPERPATSLQKKRLPMGSFQIWLECGRRKGETWIRERHSKKRPPVFQAWYMLNSKVLLKEIRGWLWNNIGKSELTFNSH